MLVFAHLKIERRGLVYKHIEIGTRVIVFEEESMMSQLFTVNRRRKYYAKLGTVLEIEEGAAAQYLIEFDDYPNDGLVAFPEKALTLIEG